MAEERVNMDDQNSVSSMNTQQYMAHKYSRGIKRILDQLSTEDVNENESGAGLNASSSPGRDASQSATTAGDMNVDSFSNTAGTSQAGPAASTSALSPPDDPSVVGATD